MIDAGTAAGIDMLAVTAPSAGVNPALRSWLERAGQRGAGPARARELHRLYRREDVRDLLPEVAVPALVLHAARNSVYDVAYAHTLANRLPRAELIVLDSADHMFWLADAAEMLVNLARFADRIAAVDGRTVVAAVAAVITEEPDKAATMMRHAGAWALANPEPDAVVAAFSSLRVAAAATSEICTQCVCRGAVDIAEITDTLTGAVVTRCVADARAATVNAPSYSPAVQAVLG